MLGALLLLIPAFYNHYPIVNPDTSTYLASGFKPETPFDRPITYGLLARAFSLNGLSLWLVIFAQAYIVAWLIFRIVKKLFADRAYVIIAICVAGLLAMFTSLSWLVCQVQPDVFTSVGYMCVALILMGGERKADRIILYLLFFLSVAVHLSHPLLFTGSLVCLLPGRRLYWAGSYTPAAKKIMILMVLSLSSIAIMGAALSKSKHVFFAATLLQKGVLHQYLHDSCGAKSYKLCAYKDALPASPDDFMWDTQSPLFLTGGWQENKPELNTIIHDILTTPAYQRLYVAGIIKQAGQQALLFDIGGGNEPQDSASNVGTRVSEYIHAEARSFYDSRQNTQNLHRAFDIPNKVFAMVVIISILIMIFAIARWRKLLPKLKILIAVSLTGIVLNLLDCAAFGVLNERFGCKMIWLLPFCSLLFLLSRFKGKAISETI